MISATHSVIDPTIDSAAVTRDTVKLRRSTLASPLGQLVLATDDQQRLCALQFERGRNGSLQQTVRAHHGPSERVNDTAPAEIATALHGYFDGDLAAIDRIPVAAIGNALQRRVWAALRRIPVGHTTSYGELARALGFDDPRAAIDVGAANAANPIAIVIPCHRVVGKDGALKGYAWGQHRKRCLLEHEKAWAIEPVPAAAPATMPLPGF